MGTLLRVDPPGGCFGSPTDVLVDRRHAEVRLGRRTRAVRRRLLPGQPEDDHAADRDYRGPAVRSPSPRRPDSPRPASTTYGSTTRSCWSPAARARPPGQSAAVNSEPPPRAHAERRGGDRPRDRLVRRVRRRTGREHEPQGDLQGPQLRRHDPTTCPAVTTNLPQQTVKICNWTIAGAAGCSTATSAGWTTLPAPPTQPQAVGSTDVSSTLDAAGFGERLHRHGFVRGPAPGARPHPAVHGPRRRRRSRPGAT